MSHLDRFAPRSNIDLFLFHIGYLYQLSFYHIQMYLPATDLTLAFQIKPTDKTIIENKK